MAHGVTERSTKRIQMESHQRDRRRSLSLDNLSQVVAEVELLRDSHRTVGRWSLAQICKHLADSINGSIDGFDLRRHRFKRFFFAKRMLRYTFRYGIPAGYTVDPNLTPPNNIDLDEAIDQLARAIDRYEQHRGRLEAHPLFGKLPRDMWNRLQCFHCAHHLRFVIPVDPGTSASLPEAETRQ